ncbi:hypothetical protein [Arthrobacter sp. FW306-2-2C-D06B]|uniref:hypothetical protein n=1 Tax=Arthrobacter sp. FW306-2-2C-D06B TaxID=2879618 RepID=UPI001F283D69|nr:hypothetical protein [Arthrobacter sp. FW306-2-2C-D06B]UKA59201.1 hypothetical protein LFT47_02255 [Arthrobacter sp. FW306-2-2C-D06B]
MSMLVDRIITEAPNLNGQDFKMLIVMASHARNNPPEYFQGWELLQEAMGWEAGAKASTEATRRKIQRLIKLGYLSRTQKGGMFRYAAYEFTFPGERKAL